jgi:hypothetical protein
MNSMEAYLLTKTDAGTGIERQEYKRLRCEILVKPVVKEAVGVELFGWLE